MDRDQSFDATSPLELLSTEEKAKIKKEFDSWLNIERNGSQQVIRTAANFIGGGMITGGENPFSLDGYTYIENYTIWNALLIEEYSY